MARTLQTVLNEGNPNKLPAACREVNLGNALAHVRTAKVEVVSNVATLPAGGKALLFVGGFATAGTTTGALVPANLGATLATGQVAPNAAGNLAFFAADAVTAAEVTYISFESEAVTVENAAVVGGVFPVGDGGARLLVSVSAGGSELTITERADDAPIAGSLEANINLAGDEIQIDPNVTLPTIIYVPFPDPSVDGALRGDVEF